ncbi:hypothetical protein A0O34_09290 [Chryseobacterium glaciei]|uniref:Uncharacterized protein n=1 Tax=Chryseobacterium glaciei TaxID=1685010 RepID=A0A172XUL2_9FLAO|nr:hypothetical protein [Chryseobacterium glaciei]ANF50703.1 hypothetical protein A0O34_09290 [Chryseobacterium glaciei]
MQNIQDLKEKIFFESKNIIDILEKINNVDELLSKQDLVDELANRISFLRLLEKNIEYFITDNSVQNSENQQNISFVNQNFESQESNNDVTEEEAIFNNEFNEIDENDHESSYNENAVSPVETGNIQAQEAEEEAIFNNQLNEIAENEYHENIVNLVEENTEPNNEENCIDPDLTKEEIIFNHQLNEIDEEQPSDYQGNILSFIDEERILADAEPETDEDINEEIFSQTITEEEVIFNNQLNEIDEFENEISDNRGNELNNFDEEEKIQDSFESKKEEKVEIIPNIFGREDLEDDEMLIEESEEQFITSNATIGQGEMVNETSNVENILSEIKNDAQNEEKYEQDVIAEEIDRRKITNIDKPLPEFEKEKLASDESFENLEAYNQEKKIRLANIKGLKAVQSLFDDDHLQVENPLEKPIPVVKEDTGSILKTNIPTNLMEAQKAKPEFKLDLNDRIAFTKTLFGGSQSDLNDVVGVLNSFRTLEEAKEYLSDLYYDRKWSKVDEYAQRLWILVENKFL